MKKILGFITLIALGAFISPAFGIYGNFDEYAADTTYEEEYKPLVIPKGSIFRGLIGQTVSSEFNNNGDIIKIVIPSDFIYEDKVIVPKNSMFIGQIYNLEKAQQGRNGFFSINIIGLVFPDNRQFALQGYIPAAKGNRVFGGEFSRRSGHKSTLHRSACFGRKGTLELLQNGPRIMGKEARIQMGELVTIVIEEAANVE
ncbi:MAG: hypothetical protein K6A44_04625 [bacterium]|nr:hypothetical protein [bacterium]